MIAALAIVGAILGAVVIVYMTPPKSINTRISVAEFLDDLPPPRDKGRRLALAAPLTSVSFYLRILILTLLALALWQHLERFDAAEKPSLGVAILIDVSDSMRTRVGSETYLAKAVSYVNQVAAHLQSLGTDIDLCTRLDAFDIDSYPLLVNARVGELSGALDGLIANPQGTNLTRAAMNIQRDADKSPQDGGPVVCEPDYVIIVTDQPAQSILSLEPATLIWRDVSVEVSNAGISRVERQRDPFTGGTKAVKVFITRWGGDSLAPTLAVKGPGMQEDVPIDWQNQEGVARFKPTQEGEYTLSLNTGDAYDGDENAILAISLAEDLQVDWRIAPNPALLQQLGWQHKEGSTLLRVDAGVAGTPGEADVPTIHIVGNSLRKGASEIAYFVEDHPILEGINYDFFESLSLPALLPVAGRRLLGGVDSTWVSATVREVWLPVTPHSLDSDISRFSMTLFLNSVRWLRERADMTPVIFTRTDGTVLADVESEGVVQTNHSSGDYLMIVPRLQTTDGDSQWPILVLLALGLFLVDRILTALMPARYE